MTSHTPVLLETIKNLLPQNPGTYIDCTFGRGGYTQAILDHHPLNRVLAIDRDPEAIAWGEQHFLPHYGERLSLLHARFSSLKEMALHHKLSDLTGILFDLGVSSPQIDTPARGFSFSKDGPLDMRMGLNTRDAASFLNEASAEEITTVLQQFGEERYARRIANKIVQTRQERPLQTTTELVSLIQETVPAFSSDIHPATRTFQGLRLWVNQELDELDQALHATPSLLTPEGSLIVVSFHSLEDRIVKQFLTATSKAPAAPNRHLPTSQSLPSSLLFKIPGKQPLRPTQAECQANPRARSARLRYALRLQDKSEHP